MRYDDHVPVADAIASGDPETVRREVTRTAYALVLDLRAVSYLDSAGVRLLFDLADRLHARRQELVVVVPAGSLLANVLRMVAMDKVAVVAPEEPNAES